MFTLSENQEKVFEAAKAQLKEHSWYRGVCLDHFPTDKEIEEIGFDAAVSRVMTETAFWDAPSITSVQ